MKNYLYMGLLAVVLSVPAMASDCPPGMYRDRSGNCIYIFDPFESIKTPVAEFKANFKKVNFSKPQPDPNPCDFLKCPVDHPHPGCDGWWCKL